MPKFLSTEQVQVITDTLAEFNFFRPSNPEAGPYARERVEENLNRDAAYVGGMWQYDFGGRFTCTNPQFGVSFFAILNGDHKTIRSVHLQRVHSRAAFSEEQCLTATKKMMSSIS
jgi:hypothetical protein